MGFLSKQARESKAGVRNRYTVAEDELIVAGLESGRTAKEIETSLKAAGYSRPVLSVQYRINLLRKNASQYATVADFHTGNKIEPDVEPEIEGD